MLVTLLGTTIDLSDSQKEKAPCPIQTKVLGILTNEREEQCIKAYAPILVTPSGIIIELRWKMEANAYSPMLVTVFGIIVFLHPATKVLVAVCIIALHLLRLSYMGLPFLT